MERMQFCKTALRLDVTSVTVMRTSSLPPSGGGDADITETFLRRSAGASQLGESESAAESPRAMLRVPLSLGRIRAESPFSTPVGHFLSPFIYDYRLQRQILRGGRPFLNELSWPEKGRPINDVRRRESECDAHHERIDSR
jgi:hypothetical protein